MASKPSETMQLDGQTAAVIERKCYRIGKKMNDGSVGQMFKGTNTATGDQIAIKVIELSKISAEFSRKFMPRELTTLTGIHHENLVYIYDIIRNKQRFFVFMEFANGGDMSGYLAKNGAISEPLTCFWFSQVVTGLQYLHEELRLAHRNLKLENILLHNNVAELTDFGFHKLSWDYDRSRSMLTETLCGSEPYLSPQLLSRKPYDAFGTDIWALGIVLFCMLNNKFPYHVADHKQMLAEQNNPNFLKERYGKKFPDDLKNLQEQLLESDEKKRLTVAAILEHPWILRKGK